MRNARLLLVLFCSAVVACAVATTLPTEDAGGGGPDGSSTDAGTKGDTGTASCTAPLIHCAGTEAGVCTDLKTSIDHCGTCGTACTAADASALQAGNGNPDSGVPLVDGGSTGPFWSTGTPACSAGACSLGCPSGMTACGDGICYDLQDFHDHCGACTTACASTDWCGGGHCCGVGTEWCGSACMDVLGDKNNCGSCGHVCGSNLTCSNGVCTSSFTVEVFPSTGTLQDPGNSSYWSARYYTMSFAGAQTIGGIAFRTNLASADYIQSEIWDPVSKTSLAKDTAVYGSGVEQFYNSPINYTVSANTQYLVGIFISNANSVFPRKDTPSYPFTVTDTSGNITVSACWSTSTTNTDIFPTSSNSWAPDLKLTIQ